KSGFNPVTKESEETGVVQPADIVEPPYEARFGQVVPTADLTGDKRSDVLAVDKEGSLFLYPGNGLGGFGTPRSLGSGWADLQVFAPGDWTGDGKADVLAKDAAGDLYLFRGNGNGTIQSGDRIGWGWTPFRIIPAG